MEMTGAYQPVLTPGEGTNPEGAGPSQIEVQPYNFMDPKLRKGCWDHILGFITESQDLEALIATSRLFSEMLQPRKLEKLVLPILMKNEFWTKETVLPSRLLNKRTKSVVDEQLMNTTPPWLSRALTCSDDGEFEDFATEFPQSSPASSSVSLLHDFKLELYSENEDALEDIMTLLRTHGARVRKLKLTLYYYISFEELSEILSLVPNLVLLAINLTYLLDYERQLLPLPPLADLEELHLIPILLDEGDREIEYLNLVMVHLVDSYGPQLRKLTCSTADFNAIPFRIRNTKLSNLREFNMEQSNEYDDGDKQFLKLIRVDWPHLKRIALGGRVHVTYELFLSLCRYRDTLEALDIEGELVWEDFTMQDLFCMKIDLGVFPKLTHLSISTSQVDSDIWQLFKTQFVNLQHLRFHPEFQFTWIPVPEGFLRKGSPIPGDARRRSLFEMFPELSQFVWAHVEAKRVVSESDADAKTFREIVFRRP